MGATHVFAGVNVADIEPARAWYERLVGSPPDLIPNEREAAWRLTDSGWIYIVAAPERAGRSTVTVLVDDLDERIEALARRGIDAGPVEPVAEGTRSVVFADPDGNEIQIAEARGAGS